jgi:hypothetical protein
MIKADARHRGRSSASDVSSVCASAAGCADSEGDQVARPSWPILMRLPTQRPRRARLRREVEADPLLKAKRWSCWNNRLV